jgi:hypothetical protein
MGNTIPVVSDSIQDLLNTCEWQLFIRLQNGRSRLSVFAAPLPDRMFPSFMRTRPCMMVVAAWDWADSDPESYCYHSELVQGMTEATLLAAEMHTQYLAGELSGWRVCDGVVVGEVPDEVSDEVSGNVDV